MLGNGNGNGERLEFLRGVVETNLINSNELRLADFDMKNITDASPPDLPAAASPRSGAVSGVRQLPAKWAAVAIGLRGVCLFQLKRGVCVGGGSGDF